MAAQASVWHLREAALGLSMATRGDGKAVSFVEDTAVAPERLREYISRFLQIVERYRTTAGVYAHASVGCLHVRPVVDMKTADGIAAFEGIGIAQAYVFNLTGTGQPEQVRGALVSASIFPVLGVQPPLADWGGMVRDNGRALGFGLPAPLWPAGAIALVTIGVNLIVDWILSINARPSGASAEM